MKFNKRRISKLAQEGQYLLSLQGLLQIISIFLVLGVVVALLYFVIPFSHGPHQSLSAGEILLLAALLVILGINNFVWFLSRRLYRKWLQLEKRSTSDSLTGAFNRSSFEEILDEEIRRAGRYH